MKTLSADKEAEVLRKEIVPFIKSAEKIVVIKNDKGLAEASEVRAQLKAYEKQVVAKKEEITKPLNQALKVARGWFSPLENQIDAVLGNINTAMIAYQTEKKAKADAEAKKIADRVGEGKGKLTLETASRKMGEIDVAEKVVETESGGTQFITVKKFEVMDVTLLPKEYIIADEVKIRAAMKGGVELDGVRYYTEEVPRNL